jgi:hypothetical protein
MSLCMPVRFASSLDFHYHQLGSTVYATAPQILLVALTAELHLERELGLHLVPK